MSPRREPPEPRRDLPDLSLIRQVLEQAAPGAVGLAHGAPTHPVPEPVLAALRKAVEAGRFEYTSNAGRPDLREAIAARRPHHGVSGDSVVVTAGSQEALALAILGLTGPGDEILVPDLAYPSYAALARFAGVGVRRAPVEALAGAITRRTRMVVVASPANPTGAVASRETLQGLAELAEERGFWLLSDEIYEEIWLHGERPPTPGGANTIHLGSISKSIGAPGLRLGWLVADPAVTARLVPLHQHLVTSAPVLSQHAALAALALPESELDAVRAYYRERWEVTRGALADLPEEVEWEKPRGAFYVLLDVSRLVPDTLRFALEQARRGTVLVVPGEAFGPDGSGYLRTSFCAPEAELEQGIDRLRQALAAS